MLIGKHREDAGVLKKPKGTRKPVITKSFSDQDIKMLTILRNEKLTIKLGQFHVLLMGLITRHDIHNTILGES